MAHARWLRLDRQFRNASVGIVLLGALVLVGLRFSPPDVGGQALISAPNTNKAQMVFNSIYDGYGDCGTWQAQYTKVHTDILSGRRPPRFTVVVAVQVGLTECLLSNADRIVGAISAFYFSLLTGRAFQISTYGELPGFELALEAPNIDWHHPPFSEDDPLLTAVKVEYNGSMFHGAKGREFPDNLSEDQRKRHDFVYNVNEADWSAIDVRKGLHRNSEAEIVLFASNRGQATVLFDNPHHKEQLHSWGLTRETAWPCAFSFLFKPRAEVVALFQRELEALSDSTALRIGINIRVGDPDEPLINGINAARAFTAEEYDLERAKAYFSCAQQIEDTRRRQLDQKVVWYVISDSKGLRQNAERHWWPKVLTNAKMHVIHPDCYHFEACLGNDTAKALAMRQAVGQLYAFAATDYQVITMSSGFGRVGAMIGSWRNTVYQIAGLFASDGVPRDCGIEDADSYNSVAGSWAGL